MIFHNNKKKFNQYFIYAYLFFGFGYIASVVYFIFDLIRRMKVSVMHVLTIGIELLIAFLVGKNLLYVLGQLMEATP
jgi:hypothetical protein